MSTAEGETLAATATPDPKQIWHVAQEELRFQLSRPGYETWLANAVLVDCDGYMFTVGVPTRLARDWLTERYVPLIRETLSGVLGRDCDVLITVDPAAAPPLDEPAPLPEYDAFEQELRYFADCAASNRQPERCPPRESALAVKVALSMLAS